jgi:O-antigen ligase
MALALACAPAYTIRFHFGPLPSTLLEVVLVVAIVVGLAAYWGDIPWRNPFTWAALLFLLGATLDVVFAPEPKAAAGLWKAYFVEPMLAGLVIAAMAPRRSRLLLLGLGLGAVVPAVVNAFVDGTQMAHHTFNTFTPQVAIYNTANAVPLFLEPPMAFALALAVHGRERVARVVAGALFIVYAIAVMLSYSRLGWITLLALVLFVAAFHRRRWWAFGIALVVAVAAFAASPEVRGRIIVEFQPSDKNSVLLRVPLWRATLDMLRDHPLFGAGLAGFKAAIEPYAARAGYHEDLIYPHNLLLNAWAETGLLGLLGFLWTLVQALRVGLRRLAQDPFQRALGIGLLGMLLTFAIHGIGDVPYFKNDQALVFWALLGVTLGAGRAADNR